MSYEQEVQEHYRQQVKSEGLEETSTMPDLVVREKELEAIFHTLQALFGDRKDCRILEIGCGNGGLLEKLHKAGYTELTGMDYLPEFVELANSRRLPAVVSVGDARALEYADDSFDVVIAERVIINLKDSEHQRQAFMELHRVLRKPGYAILIEGFEDAWVQSNAARAEFGLPQVPMPAQNRWYKEGEVENWIAGKMRIITEANGIALTPRNFLSSHYFMSRVVHSMLTHLRAQAPDHFAAPERNSHFARFFGTVLPPHGNYAPVQFLCLRAE